MYLKTHAEFYNKHLKDTFKDALLHQDKLQEIYRYREIKNSIDKIAF